MIFAKLILSVRGWELLHQEFGLTPIIARRYFPHFGNMFGATI